MPVGRISGMTVSAMTGKPKLIAPAAAAYFRSSTSPSASTKANTRSLLYSRMLRAMPPFIPPKVRAEWHSVGVVAEFDAFFHQLMDDAPPVDVTRQEAQNVALLQFAHDLDRHLVGFGAADDGREARHTAIHQLNAPRPELDVVNRPVQVAVERPFRAFAVVRAGERCAACQLEAGHRLRLHPVQVADHLDHLCRDQRCHP